MKVFSAYFKVLRKNIIGIAIYMLVFLVVVIFSTLGNQSDETTGFEETKTALTIINEDGDHVMTAGLIAYLQEHSVSAEVKNDREMIQDALFFRVTEYVLRIPKGFSENFGKDGELSLEKTAIGQSFGSVYVDSMVNRYLNTWRAYQELAGDMAPDKIQEYVKEDIEKEAAVSLGSGDTSENHGYSMSYYFNMAAYSTLSVIIIGVCIVMGSFYHKDLKRRIQCSPMRTTRMNVILAGANLNFAFAVFALNILVGFVIFGRKIFSTAGIFMCLNLFIFTIATLSISMLVVLVVKSKAAQNAAANTISLGMCFLGGAFVPQFLLGDSIKLLASFTPAYWYIKANNEIDLLETFTLDTMQGILTCYAVEVGFAVAIFSLALFISKQRAMAGYSSQGKQ